MRTEIPAVVAMGCLIIITQSLAVFLALPFAESGYQAFPDPEDPVNPLLYVILILAFSALILLAVRMGRKKFLRFLILLAIFLTMIFVLSVPLFYLFIWAQEPEIAELASMIISICAALTLTLVVYKNPEWYVVDGVGITVAAGVTAIIGISFAILPAIILLVALAAYDAISVYKTKHMVTLADAITEQHLPILLVIPKSKSYSYKTQKSLKDQIKKKKREAMFMGLGDIIIPGSLVVSAFRWLPTEFFLGLPARVLVSLFTMIGVIVGFSILMRFVIKGNPQAGLPLLNAGAILGFTISYVAFYGNLGFGIG
ncbi:MAG: presenilin family intramembrane aspartyl protease PSH [Thermoplasmata archaeon]